MTVGSLLGVAAVLAWSQVQQLWQLYARVRPHRARRGREPVRSRVPGRHPRHPARDAATAPCSRDHRRRVRVEHLLSAHRPAAGTRRLADHARRARRAPGAPGHPAPRRGSCRDALTSGVNLTPSTTGPPCARRYATVVVLAPRGGLRRPGAAVVRSRRAPGHRAAGARARRHRGGHGLRAARRPVGRRPTSPPPASPRRHGMTTVTAVVFALQALGVCSPASPRRHRRRRCRVRHRLRPRLWRRHHRQAGHPRRRGTAPPATPPSPPR